MRNPWDGIKPITLPPGVAEGVETFTKGVDVYVKVLTIAKDLLNTLASLEISSLSTAQLAIDAATKTVESALQSLMQDVGMYILLIPPRKRLVIPPAVEAALAKRGQTVKDFLDATSDKNLIKIQVSDDTTLRAYLNRVRAATGGNEGFLRTLFESLADAGDPNRPILKPTDAVAGACMVAGATDYAQLLLTLSAFASFFGAGRDGVGVAPPGMPVPKQLHVSATPSGMFLEWEYQPSVTTLPGVDLSVAIDQVAVIRSSSPAFIGATHCLDVFGTVDLHKGDPGDGGAEVVAVFSDPTKTNIKRDYLDTAATKGGPFYYAVSYRWRVGSLVDVVTGGGTDAGFQQLSSVVKAAHTKTPVAGSARSTAPDWIRTPSVAGAIPALDKLVSRLSVATAQFGNIATGYAELMKMSIEHLDKQITRYADIALEIGNTVKRLTALFNPNPYAGMHVLTFAGVGGEGYLQTELTSAFSESNLDPMRPHFDEGDEFVGGVVVLAVAPTLGELKPFQTMLDRVLNDQEAAKDATLAALTELEAAFEAAETVIMLEPRVEHAAIGVDDPGNCPVPHTPVEFGDDLKPKE